MDESSDTRQVIPDFIRSAITQLISLKTNVALIDDIHDDMRGINANVDTDIINIANKLKEFASTLKTTISDINNKFVENYDTFIKEILNNKTVNSVSKNTNFYTKGESKQTNKIHLNTINDSSDSDVPLIKVIKKDEKKNNEESDSNFVKKYNSRKRRKKRKSASSKHLSSNSDSEHTINSDKVHYVASKLDKTKSDITTVNNDSNDKESTSKSNINDSDKENANEVSKESFHLKHTSDNSEDETEKETDNITSTKETKSSKLKCTTGKYKKKFDSDSDSDISVQKSTRTRTKTTRDKSDSERNNEISKLSVEDKNKSNLEENDPKNKEVANNKISLFDSDSDSYIEDPRTIIENSKKALEEKRKSTTTSKESLSLNINEIVNTLCSENLDTSTGMDPVNKENNYLEETNVTNNESMLDTSGSLFDDSLNKNENFEKVANNVIKHEDTQVEENEDDDKPKFGLIKCIDINKLLDPKVKTIPSPKSRESIIILSSSDSETNIKLKSPKRKNKTNKKMKEILNNDSNENIIYVDTDKSIKNNKRMRSHRQKKSEIAKKSFEEFRCARRRNLIAKSASVDQLSTTSVESDSNCSIYSDISEQKTKKYKQRKEITKKSNKYDYKVDLKFKSKCYVSLPRIPVEKLKEHYIQQREDVDIQRLTNMKSLKRTRQLKETPSSSDSDAKSGKIKKRTKLQQKGSSNEEQSEHSDLELQLSDKSMLETSKQDVALPIPEDILESDDENNKLSDSADNEEKIKKSKTKNKSDKKTEKENENQAEDKGKSKWKNDPLLKGKLSVSDSDDELIRFRNKKNKIVQDIKSETEEAAIISKKSKTKKQLKRIARRLGSDVSSSEDEVEYKKSESEKESSDKSDNEVSDSDDGKKKKKPIRRRIKKMNDSDESTDAEGNEKKEKKKKEEEEQSTRKKIRHVWSKDSLADSTKEAAKEEEERKKRIADRQKLYNEIYDNKYNANATVDKVILDFNEETKEELLSVHQELVKKLKPHQAKGVQFMWTACFESIERAQNTEGSGCILAHCMGLGKTLQVITLIHTLLSNSDKTNVKTALVVCPLSTVLNWVNEFKKWLDDLDGEDINVFDLVQYRQNYERLYQMQDWMKFGGVLVMGYDMFRNLSNPKGKRMPKKLVNGFNKVLLEPGPDLVVCDEGHLLKNEKTGISIAMNRLRTKRRIVLTGTPLQNNLKEYFCMVQFVKPNLLGTYKEYLNRFVNPITNGQYTDSTPHDIQIMRKRAHVLHKMLDAVVERRDYNVLAPFLPPKHEYVLFVCLTGVQIELYREYLTKFSRNTNVKGTSYLFQDFQELQRICIHPRVLLDKSNQDKLRKEVEDDEDSEGSLKDFINDDDSDKSSTPNESTSESDSDSDKKAAISTRRTRSNPGNIEEEPEPVLGPEEWWSKFCQGDELDNICHSSKISLLFEVLHQCEMIGDKVLVFSQSLYSLNLIEYFLARIDEATQSGDTEALAKVGGYTGSWALGLDYFRMDGSTSCDNRSTWCNTFNNDANTRARLFLISTRAGGLGINLVAANRVIIFDVSWNPSFDIQSIYRVYRFGQTKPSYVYRFVTLGTMENKIYERQVTKQAISKRVIDEQQIDRHYNQNDLAELYAFNPVPDEERPIPLVPKDRLFADLLQSHAKHIFKYHEHNSLLENKADEGLNEEERKAAWEEFENEKKAPKFNLMQTMVRNGMFETLRILVQEDNNGWTPAQINNILPAVVQRISEQVSKGDYSMYRRVEERHEMRVLEQRRMQIIYQQYMQQLRNASGGVSMTPADITKIAQMFSTYNQSVMQQPQRPQMPSGSAAVSFRQDIPPAPLPPGLGPTPHPAINEVVELND